MSPKLSGLHLEFLNAALDKSIIVSGPKSMGCHHM